MDVYNPSQFPDRTGNPTMAHFFVALQRLTARKFGRLLMFWLAFGALLTAVTRFASILVFPRKNFTSKCHVAREQE